MITIRRLMAKVFIKLENGDTLTNLFKKSKEDALTYSYICKISKDIDFLFIKKKVGRGKIISLSPKGKQLKEYLTGINNELRKVNAEYL